SPPTFSTPISALLLEEALALFGYNHADLDERISPAHINGGAGHLLLALNSRARLKAMRYDQQAGHDLMAREGWATILLAWAETDQLFHTRNPFAFGGVYEDPATGAATAALGGYLRDIDWPHGGLIDIIQGEDMGSPSRLRAEIPQQRGSSIRVSGMARRL
ncbi:PhzF family phenazine biosynthesis protein, partial [Pseudomonas syringae]